MSTTMTREEIFQEVLRSPKYTGDESTADLRRLCDDMGMFEDDPGLTRASIRYKDDVIRDLARQGGWVDKDGNELRIYNVVRPDPETGKNAHRYIDLRLASFDDQAYLVRDRLAKAEYFHSEARDLYRDGCHKFGRKFQRLFQFD